MTRTYSRYVRAGRRSWENRMSEQARAAARAEAKAIIEERREAIERAQEELIKALKDRQIPSELGYLRLRAAPGTYEVFLNKCRPRVYLSAERAIGVIERALRLGFGMDAFSVDTMLKWCGRLMDDEVKQLGASATAGSHPLLGAYNRFTRDYSIPISKNRRMILWENMGLYNVKEVGQSIYYRLFGNPEEAVQYVHRRLLDGFALDAHSVNDFLGWCLDLLNIEAQQICCGRAMQDALADF